MAGSGGILQFAPTGDSHRKVRTIDPQNGPLLGIYL